MLPSLATPQATQELVPAHPAIPYNPLGNTGLMVSAAGFGCYRVDAEIEEHHVALEKALLAGVNLIDTSANYADGNSERLVGQVLGRLCGAGILRREQVVVVSKAGYLQGQNLALSQERKKEGRPFPDLVEVDQELEHCLHPEFLADQLERSLERLGLERLDVLLLHNPEYYLNWAAQQRMELGLAREEFYRRLQLAFGWLEEQAQMGRIGCYGISSNTLPHASEHPEFVSLARAWLLAQALGSGHHFRVVEFPCNLLETAAITRPNQPGGQSLWQQARQLRLGILVNRPLNALDQGRLLRLAEVETSEVPTPELVEGAVADLLASERQIRTQVLASLDLEEGQSKQLAEYISAAPLLSEHWTQFQGLEHWRSVQGEYFLPRIHAAFQYIIQAQPPASGAQELISAHLEQVRATFRTVEAVYLAATAQDLANLRQRVEAAEPEWAQAPSMSQMALRALRSTQGLSAVLVGMRQASYVADVLAELARPIVHAPRAEAWQAMLGQPPQPDGQ